MKKWLQSIWKWVQNTASMFQYFWKKDPKTVTRWILTLVAFLLLLYAMLVIIVYSNEFTFAELKSMAVITIFLLVLFIPLDSINGNIKKWIKETKEG